MAACTPFIDKVLRARREVDTERRLLEATTNQIIVLNDALDPVVEELGRIVDCDVPDRAAAVGQLKSLALTAATKVISAEKVRAGYFEVKTSPVESVVPVLHAGRAGRNRTTFTAATSAGRAVLKMLKDDEHILCKDTRKDPPTGWDRKRKQRDYKTFISVPVRAGDSLFGMLTVDAPEAGSLTEVDAAMVRIIGNLIAVAVSVSDTKGAL